MAHSQSGQQMTPSAFNSFYTQMQEKEKQASARLARQVKMKEENFEKSLKKGNKSREKSVSN